MAYLSLVNSKILPCITNCCSVCCIFYRRKCPGSHHTILKKCYIGLAATKTTLCYRICFPNTRTPYYFRMPISGYRSPKFYMLKTFWHIKAVKLILLACRLIFSHRQLQLSIINLTVSTKPNSFSLNAHEIKTQLPNRQSWTHLTSSGWCRGYFAAIPIIRLMK